MDVWSRMEPLVCLLAIALTAGNRQYQPYRGDRRSGSMRHSVHLVIFRITY